MDDLTARAMTAYFRRRAPAGEPTNISPQSGVREHDGRQYVVLCGDPGGALLAVYRVHNDGTLKWMVRNWPKEIEQISQPRMSTIPTFPDRDMP